MQTTSHLLMIRPVDFKFNEQTADDNKFQMASEQENVQQKALAEFDGFVNILRENGVDVTIISDTLDSETPDSIFPNNWVSFHEDGSVFLYPMHSPNRRQERRKDIIDYLAKTFEVSHQTDLSFFELQERFLEGTGSMVLDRTNKIAYACLSVRTDKEVLENFAMLSGYGVVAFQAVDEGGFPIYHTNVMMCIGEKFTVVCLDSIKYTEDKIAVLESFKATNKTVIDISFEQMNHFAGNMLEVQNKDGESLLVMSEQALKALHGTQITALSAFSKIVTAPIYTIEQNGGGSARCMLAEIHLPLKR
ncbi:MAG: arginine deiminase-related protein [Pedobacter sp.]|uniref:citrulline utilization hydrolase CtlX n=1 Tax=Pedobacter sp. TaxID=1411316 RepID=UPI00280A36EB|nr:arginine deiminase-related protein [Pedobacter sp.]MDQ8003356.1 arginine deiminase-related protein [Pedobacter sp.]